MPDAPPISDEMLKTMTPEQLSRAGIALRMEIEIPPDSGKKYHLLAVPTRDVKKHVGKAPIVVTYTELDGVCQAHRRTQDPRIGIDTLIGLAQFRERAAAEGVNLMAMAIVGEDEGLPE